jgi:hypothetical protein
MAGNLTSTVKSVVLGKVPGMQGSPTNALGGLFGKKK